jgi:hypothetical protein
MIAREVVSRIDRRLSHFSKYKEDL